MSTLQQLGLLLIGSALVSNILLTRFIALCSFFGISNSMETSWGMSLAVLFVMVMASSVTWVAYYFLLVPLGVGEFLYIPAFILVIAALVQFVEMYLKKSSPTLYRAMGIYLPLITTNCAVLAAATESVKPGFFKMNMPFDFSFLQAVVYTAGVALGYGFALLCFTAIRERLDVAPVPKWLKGTPMSFICAGLLSLGYIGLGSLFGL
ncbi:MAG: electron transport complex subunit RsxA [Actinobacteria bacterium]|nr:MAG: electron transport complex subunit RsxA [Actinomycetota bacterium]